MSKSKVVELLLGNIELFEQITEFVEEEFSINLFRAIDETLKDEFSDWHGKFDFWENYTSFAPDEWRTNRDNREDSNLGYKNAIAQYNLSEFQELNTWWVSNLFGANGNSMTFEFQVNWGNEIFKFNKTKWKTLFGKINEEHPEIQELGFKLNVKDGIWYLPIQQLDINKVVQCYDDDLTEAMDPILESCKVLRNAHKIFEKIMENLIKEK